ncbi:exosortase-dependent surface protein XDP1 [Alteromonas abrolhosensis]|uniref:exosortase-dependent surface protein XDP1 n=1 Tax=Alteromonas abrolhosensis TaxID=1892904 RepID=UPI003515AAF3
MKLVSLANVFVLLFTGSVVATETTLDEFNYNLNQDGINNTTNAQSGVTVSIDGRDVKVGLTTWSDTGFYKYSNDYDYSERDNVVKQQQVLSGYRNNNGSIGYGLTNKDTKTVCVSTNWYGSCNSYSTRGDQHTIDNVRNEYGKQDFDMILLSFSESVTLTSGSFSSAYHYNNTNSSKEVSVVGLSDIDKFQSGENFTWSDIALNSAIGAATGHYSVGSQLGNYYQSEFTGLSAAKYWLVGAYNTIFDNGASQQSDFGFKLSALGFSIDNTPDTPNTPPTQVSEPGALALMSLGLGLVLYRRKRRV